MMFLGEPILSLGWMAGMLYIGFIETRVENEKTFRDSLYIVGYHGIKDIWWRLDFLFSPNKWDYDFPEEKAHSMYYVLLEYKYSFIYWSKGSQVNESEIY